MSTDKKESIAKAPSGRPVRQSTGTRNKFNYLNKDPAFEYRVAVDNDGTGDRIAELKDLGYEMAPAGVHRLGTSRVDEAGRDSSLETMNSGGGNKGYLMRINKEWFEDDKKAKAERINETEQGLKTPPIDGTYGQIEIGKK